MSNWVTTIKDLFGFGKHYLKSLRNDNSFAGEYPHIKNLMERLNLMNGFIVDIAASDGFSQSCTHGFFKDSNWVGLAVEMDPKKFAKLAFLYSNFPHAKLARSRITPYNINSILKGYEVPTDFTFLNLDIDSYDLHVIDELLKSNFRPKIISIEINEKFPPPLYFTVDYDDSHFWKGDHFFGCSLAAASETIKPYGYKLESLQYNNAIFVQTSICDDIIDDLSLQIAYDSGYRNKSDRKKLFPYNSNVDCVLEFTPDQGLLFFNELFKDYKGKFTLRA